MEEEAKKKQESEVYYGVGAFLFELIKMLLLAAIIIFPIKALLFQPFFVKGASMDPNFSEGDYLIVNEWGYKNTEIGFWGLDTGFAVHPFKDVVRGTPVVIRSPEGTRSGADYFIKRVIGLPGETVVIENGRVKIINAEHPDGYILDESAYLHPSVKTTGTGMTLGDDEYFVMGDNRGNSSDSRSWGALKKNRMIGTVSIRIFPVSSFSLFSVPGYK